MSTLAIGIYVLYLTLAFGLRSWIQWRQTGHTGFVGIRGRPGSVEWVGGMLFVVALVLGFAAPVLGATGALDGVAALDSLGFRVGGVALSIAGIAATLTAQFAMGTSWRIGVDLADRTALVTDGPFGLVRNPIFAAMLPTALGLVLLVPNWVGIAGLAALFAALELQTRLVEEPYLLSVHGDAYARYSARVGRFVPGVGRLQRSVRPAGHAV